MHPPHDLVRLCSSLLSKISSAISESASSGDRFLFTCFSLSTCVLSSCESNTSSGLGGSGMSCFIPWSSKSTSATDNKGCKKVSDEI